MRAEEREDKKRNEMRKVNERIELDRQEKKRKRFVVKTHDRK